MHRHPNSCCCCCPPPPCCGSRRGSTGPQGPQGAQGERGRAGPQGPQGGASVQNIITDADTANIVGNAFSLLGISGITTSASGSTVTIDNLRDLSEYVVDSAGGSEFTTVQAAYAQAVTDGRGGPAGLPAVILIRPGSYSFGTTPFLITRSGIYFVGISGSPISRAVVFTAQSTSGGIDVSIPFSFDQRTIFRGITFGQPNDTTNGFLFSHSTGQCDLLECDSSNSNVRFVVGGTSLAITGLLLCTFNTVTPSNFLETRNAATVVVLMDSDWTQLTFNGGSPPPNGGSLFDFSLGIAEFRAFHSTWVFNNYDNFVKGPAPGVGGEGTISITNSYLINNDGSNPASLIHYSGPFNAEIRNSTFSMAGRLLYQDVNSNSGDSHNFIMTNSAVRTQTTMIETANSLTTLGANNFYLASTFLDTSVLLIVNMPSSSDGADTVTVILTNSTIRTVGTSMNAYANGPGITNSTFRVGFSSSINGTNTVTNWNNVLPLTPL